MSKKTIMVCDHIHQGGLDKLSSLEDINYINISNDKENLYTHIAKANVVITRSSTPINEAFLEKAISLESVVRAGVGIDNIDVDACTKRGVVVMNVPTANTIAAVELTLCHLTSCVRAFPYAHNAFKNERIWKREDWYGTELKNKQLGVIGFGNIGSKVAIRAKAFDMKVVVYDPYINSQKVNDANLIYTSNFDDILQSDIITIHTPKNKETTDIIKKEQIDKMKDGVILINCARGGLYNEDDLYDGLKTGKIRFAGIDVFNEEPSINNKLLDLDNVIATPHLGANTMESQKNISLDAVNQAILAVRGISYENAFNMAINMNNIDKSLNLYPSFVQKMAFLCTEFGKDNIKKIEIGTLGEVSKLADSLLACACVGAIRHNYEHINYVNYEIVAKELGVELETSQKEKKHNHNNAISLRITFAHRTVTIVGTIISESIEHIISIDDYVLDFEPKGKVIFFKNSNVLGVVGEFGTFLGQEKINISDLSMGMKENSALVAINVDTKISDEALEKLKKLDACISARYIEL